MLEGLDQVDWSQLLTWAALLTAPTPIVAGAIRYIVEALKGMFPRLDAHVSGLRLSYYVAGALAVLAFVFGTERTPDAGLVVLWAWIAWSTSAAGVNATIDKFQQRKGPETSEGVADLGDELIDDTPAGSAGG